MHPGRETPSPPTPKREIQLQGPRPAPLRISKDSQKIKKPPIAPKPHAPPHASHHAPAPQSQAGPTQPLIIYSVSPKPIHVDASNFMSIVQQLTGRDPQQPTTSSTNPSQVSAPVSPAARMAAMGSPRDRTSPRPARRSPTARDELLQFENILQGLDMDVMDTLGGGGSVGPQMPGILSPAPGNLPPATTPGLFSPAIEGQTQGQVLFGLGDYMMSPLMGNNVNFLPSPSSMFFSVVSPTPSPGGDPFNLFHF